MAAGIQGADLAQLQHLVQQLGGPFQSELQSTLNGMNQKVQASSSYWVARNADQFRNIIVAVRNGKPMRLGVVLKKIVALVPPPQPSRRPSYFIYAGLVFMPLTYDYMSTWKWDDVTPRFKHYYYNRLPSERHAQIVIVNQVLPHDINVGYHQLHGAVVERINGVEIRGMTDLARAFAAPAGRFHVLELDYHGTRGESSDYHASYGTRAAALASSTIRVP